MPAEKKTTKPKTTSTKETVAQSLKNVKIESNEKFKDDDMIMCMSCTAGKLMYTGRRTNDLYIWDEMGVSIPVAYKDLRAEMMNSKSKYIYGPLFLILDEEVYEQFDNVKKLYEDMLSQDAISRILTKGSEKALQNLYDSLSAPRKDVLSHVIVDYIKDGTLTDYRQINLLCDVFNKDFTMAQQRR